MSEIETDWGKSAAAVVIKDGCVLMVRHTYGAGKGLLIIPGGYLRRGELPEAACRREVFEETGVEISVVRLLGMRFNQKDWYAVFEGEYVRGEPRSDNDENSEAVWLELSQVDMREDIPELSKRLINAAVKGRGMELTPFVSREHSGDYLLYT